MRTRNSDLGFSGSFPKTEGKNHGFWRLDARTRFQKSKYERPQIHAPPQPAPETEGSHGKAPKRSLFILSETLRPRMFSRRRTEPPPVSVADDDQNRRPAPTHGVGLMPAHALFRLSRRRTSCASPTRLTPMRCMLGACVACPAEETRAHADRAFSHQLPSRS